MAEEEGALAGVRIVDLTDERGIYGAKLLADLGADVVRPEPPSGDPLRNRGPHADDGKTSLWYAFFASSRRFFEVDTASDQSRAQLRTLVANADAVLSCPGTFALEAAELDTALTTRPNLVVVDTSSFGSSGPWRDYLAPDLVAGALGGIVGTTGDVDTSPLKTFGELNFMVSGAYTAIAALAALNCARHNGVGQRVEVPVHECIASCLEHVLMFAWYHDHLTMAQGPNLERRGSLHWSNAYVVMQALGGSIMVTPTPNFDAQLAWLIEEDAADDLIDPKYHDPENRGIMVARVMELLRKWVGEQDVETLFEKAQARHSPYGWVLPLEKVADNPQLEARDWWVNYRLGEIDVKGPGAPYRFSRTPWSMRSHGDADSDTKAVLADIGWSAER